MTPFSDLPFFLIFLPLMLVPVVCGLRGRTLRVPGMLVTAAMLLLIYDTPARLLTLLAFWAWQSAVIFGYLRLRRRCAAHGLLFAALAPALRRAGLIPRQTAGKIRW